MALFHTNVLDPQIKALPTVSTASGSIATFDTDMTENLVEVKCQIVAQQSGSGTPSPSNPRPITTYTEMDVVATGKNLTTIFTDGKVPSISTGALVNAGGGRSNFVPVLPNTYYTFSIASTAQNLYIFYYRNDKSFISYDGLSTQALTGQTPNDCAFIMLRTASNASQITDAQFEKGAMATTYEPFGTTANIPFGQTVANGVLDVTTGKLEITYGIVDLGNLNWTKDTTTLSVVVFRAPIDDRTIGTLYGVCDKYLTSTDTRDYLVTHDLAMTRWNATGTNVAIRDDSLSSGTATDFTTAVTGAYLVYELATPIEIQLDSITLQALLNENNIWCDTGDTEVKYLLTVGKKIS